MTGIYRLYFRAPHHPWETAYLRIVRHSRALHPLVPHIHNRAYALRQRTACGRLHYRCFQFIKDRIKGKSCFRATKNLEAIEASRFCVGGRYRTQTCDPLHVNRNLKFFIIFSVCFDHFCSVRFAFQHSLSLLFPHIPHRPVAVCVVKCLAEGFRSSHHWFGFSNRQISFLVNYSAGFCDAVSKEDTFRKHPGISTLAFSSRFCSISPHSTPILMIFIKLSWLSSIP